MTEKTYNGWTNYETWAAHLWLTSSTAQVYDIAVATAKASETDREDNIRKLVEELTGTTLEEASLASDLLSSAIQRINWREIGNALASD